MQGSRPWNVILAVAGAAAVLAVAGALATAFAAHTSPQREPSPAGPQPGVIVSYRFQQLGAGPGGGGCTGGGVVATVRLNDGELVRAASLGYVIVQEGSLVTVQKVRPLCSLATYTILHPGAPKGSANPAPADRARSHSRAA